MAGSITRGLVSATLLLAAPAAVATAQTGVQTQPAKPAAYKIAPTAQVSPIPMGQAGTRGVRVLQAEPDPTPAPPPRPTPSPAVRPSAPAHTQTTTQAIMPIAPVIKFCDRPFANPDLKLNAGADIDRPLGQRLRARKQLVVDLGAPYPERDAPPAALSAWLSEVEAGGGTVTVKQYCSAARGGLGSWLAKVAKAIRGERGPSNPYAAARDYDVVLHADALDRVVTQVEFKPKAQRAGS